MRVFDFIDLDGGKKKPLVSGTVDQSGGTFSFYINRTASTPSSGGTTITVPVGSDGYFEWNNEQGYNITSLAGMFRASSTTATNAILKTIEFSGDAANLPSLRTDYMFYNQAKLSDVKGVEYLTSTNMNRMFNGCSRLTSVGNLSNWDTSNVTNMAYLFSSCSALTSVGNISNWNTSKVTGMAYLFNGCSRLTSVGNLSNWDTSNVTNMWCMFSGCSVLTSINGISGWNVGKVTRMDSMFRHCDKLRSVDLSNWDTSNVTRMDSMFDSCSALTSINGISGWDVGKVTNINHIFQYCSVLRSLDLSNWNTVSLTKMTNFFHTSGITSIRLDNWVTTQVTEYGEISTKGNVYYKPSLWNNDIIASNTLVTWISVE